MARWSSTRSSASDIAPLPWPAGPKLYSVSFCCWLPRLEAERHGGGQRHAGSRPPIVHRGSVGGSVVGFAVAAQVLRIQRDVDGCADPVRQDRGPGPVEEHPGDVAVAT